MDKVTVCRNQSGTVDIIATVANATLEVRSALLAFKAEHHLALEMLECGDIIISTACKSLVSVREWVSEFFEACYFRLWFILEVG
jgi:hypothetical protein